jgi:L-2-hydroxyglutarate oxidase LhgO
MSDIVDSIVIGAGVVGLAVARQLALAGREVVVLEAAEAIGTETSSRNSEVIHAGIYYAKDSLKARLCVDGKHRLYEFCASHGIAHDRRGKLIVATDADELPVLADIAQKAANNGVNDLYEIDAAKVKEMEPAVRCVGALVSPSTGIIDSHGLMLAYQGEAEDHGAMFAFHSRVAGGEASDENFTLSVDIGNGETMQLGCRTLVNAAGLYAQATAARIDGIPAETVPPAYFCKGSYFSLQGRPPFRHLIYPVPRSASLGVHVTLDMGGQVKFGPDQEWVDHIDYDVDPSRADEFYEAVRRYYPDLKDGALIPAYSGMRPKIQAPDEPARDFLIQGPADHGLAGLVNLYGIESPGLTASLAIAAEVERRLAHG